MIHHTPSLLDEEEEEDAEVEVEQERHETAIDATTEATTIVTTHIQPIEKSATMESLEHWQRRNESVRHRCDEIRAARRHCARQRHACREQEVQLNEAVAHVQRQHDQALVRYAGVLSHQRNLTRLVRLQQQWNVVQADAFAIDCHVPQNGGTSTNATNVSVNINTVATINGLRLGNYIAVAAAAAAGGADSIAPLESNGTLPPQPHRISQPIPPPQSVATIPHRFFPFVSSPNPAHTTVPSPFPSSVDLQSPTTTVTTPVFHTNTTIPWREINAALGQVALVLSILEQQLLVTTTTTSATSTATPMLRYELVCRGSTSRIGLRKTPPSTNAYFNLYFTPSSNADATTPSGSASSWASYFLLGPSDRNFNMALTMLLDCVAELATVLCTRDPTIQIPYTMVVRHGTIGGLPIVRFPTASTPTATSPLPNPAETWTRAMKYLLTNLKHMMAFRGLGLFATPICV